MKFLKESARKHLIEEFMEADDYYTLTISLDEDWYDISEYANTSEWEEFKHYNEIDEDALDKYELRDYQEEFFEEILDKEAEELSRIYNVNITSSISEIEISGDASKIYELITTCETNSYTGTTISKVIDKGIKKKDIVVSEYDIPDNVTLNSRRD